MPKLSIITINLNNATGLQKTMESVFAQTFTDYEYIIIDGGSTDGSKELIENHANKLAYWISEKDKGIYNAMNKGIVKAKGEYLLFLNSSDVLLDKKSLNLLFDQKFDEDIVYWDMRNNVKEYDIIYPDKLRFSFFLDLTLVHQSTIIKRKLFEQFGLYNEQLKIVSDWEFFIKVIFLYNVSAKHLFLFIVQYDFSDGLSKQPEMIAMMEKERKFVLEKYFHRFLEDYKDAKNYKIELNNRLSTSLKFNSSFIRTIRKIRKKIFF